MLTDGQEKPLDELLRFSLHFEYWYSSEEDSDVVMFLLSVSSVSVSAGGKR